MDGVGWSIQLFCAVQPIPRAVPVKPITISQGSFFHFSLDSAGTPRWPTEHSSKTPGGSPRKYADEDVYLLLLSAAAKLLLIWSMMIFIPVC